MLGKKDWNKKIFPRLAVGRRVHNVKNNILPSCARRERSEMDNSNKKLTMTWSEEKDNVLMRQMAGFGIFEYKAGSKERGKCWQEIAQTLNTDNRFGALTIRGARDRFTLLARRAKARIASEVKSSGGGGEQTSEHDQLVEELIELCEESDKKFSTETEAKIEKADIEKQQGLDMRKKAMETMGQTRRREREADDDDEIKVKEKKKRRTGTDTVAWLEQKREMEEKWRKIQLEEQRAERELLREEKKEEMEIKRKQVDAQISAQRDQQNQQTMMFQQMCAMMQQQQNMLECLSKLRNGSGN